MDKEAGKKAAAEAAIEMIDSDWVVGVGTGTTVEYFINALAKIKSKIDGAVATSIATANKLKAIGVPVFDLNAVGNLPIYVDGADEINHTKQMIKGGGGALTQEKIVAMNSKKFVCIADDSKYVDLLGEFPVPVEVIPLARSYVGRQIVQLGGTPNYREGIVTDNGNVILDVYNLDLTNALIMEEKLKSMVGVVENGVFAKRKADVLLLGSAQGVKKI